MTCRVCFSFDRDDCLKKSTAIPCIFRRDTLWNCLRTFKLTAGVEPRTLRTGVKISCTLRTLTVETNRRRQCRATSGTFGHFMEARHVDFPRLARTIAPPWAAITFRLPSRRASLRAWFVVVLITALSVFSRHRIGEGSSSDLLYLVSVCLVFTQSNVFLRTFGRIIISPSTMSPTIGEPLRYQATPECHIPWQIQ